MGYRVLLAGMCALGLSCGGGGHSLTPDTDEFDLDPIVQAEVDAAAQGGRGAEGTYASDATGGTIVLTITASTFSCGIEVGSLTATVVELTATTMVWSFADGGGVTWTRLDGGDTGVVGVWRSDDPHLYLVLSASGAAQIFGEPEVCVEERARNSSGCLEVYLDAAAIAIDGDLGDWDAVGQGATLADEPGDALSADPGADVRALKVAYVDGRVYALMALGGAPSQSFQARQPPNGGSYRLTIRGQNGLSLMHRVAYDPDTATWVALDDVAAIDFAVGADGIEWSVDVSAYVGQGFDSVDLVLVEPLDCGSGSCEVLDQSMCAFFAVP